MSPIPSTSLYRYYSLAFNAFEYGLVPTARVLHRLHQLSSTGAVRQPEKIERTGKKFAVATMLVAEELS